MKIKQLSLCVLTAFALMACGGGDSQPTVKATAKPVEKPKINEITPVHPVPANLQAAVKEAKKLPLNTNPDDTWITEKILLTIAGKEYDLSKESYDLSGVMEGKYGSTVQEYKGEHKGHDDTESLNGTYTGQALVYNLPYSLMAGYLPLDFKGTYTVDGKQLTTAELKKEGYISIFTVDRIAGYGTKDIAELSTATYQGKAFAQNGNTISDAGKLNYTIDFANRKGKGSIQLLPGGDWELKEAPLTNHKDSFLKGANYTIQGDAMRGSKKHLYNLGLYGPKAEGIMGVIHENDREGEAIVGFGGEKQK